MPVLETHVEGAGGDIAGGKLVLLDETATHLMVYIL
jgi:hypothetical protein